MGRLEVFKKTTFAGGMLSDQMLARSNQDKYQTGSRLLSNAYVQRHGMATSRPGTLFDQVLPHVILGASYESGTRYSTGCVVTYAGVDYAATQPVLGVTPPNSTYWTPVSTAPTSTAPLWRVFRMVVDYNDSYELLFTTNLLRICKGGQPITVSYASQSGWSGAVAYTAGNIVQYGGALWICQTPNTNITPVSGSTWRAMQLAAGSSTSYILDMPLNQNAGVNYGVQVPQAALATMQVVNYNNVITCVCQLFPPFQITRTNDQTWSVALVTVAAGIQSPTNVNGSNSGTGTYTYQYAVTAINGANAESQPTLTGIITGAAINGTSQYNTITWNAVANATGYNIYFVSNGQYGLIGTTSSAAPGGGLSFQDHSGQPNSQYQQPQFLMLNGATALFTGPSNWPGVVFYYQQRIGFAASVSGPTTIWMSRTSGFASSWQPGGIDFTVTTPITDSCAILASIAGQSAQPIVACVDLRQLIIHTADGEYVVTGNAYGAVTPSAFVVQRHGSRGSKLPMPLVIGNTDIFLQARGTFLQDFKYDVRTFQFGGKDLTMYAADIFRGRTVVDMCWQQIPDSVIWCVLSDGTMASMTYIGGITGGDDGIWAWAEHSLGSITIPGVVTGQQIIAQSIACVPNGTSDTVYIIAYSMSGETMAQVLLEIAPREYVDSAFLSDFIGADQSSTFSAWTGTQPFQGSVSSSTGGYTPTDTILFTAGSATFSATDVGKSIALTPVNVLTGAPTLSQFAYATIVAYTSPTVVQIAVGATLPGWVSATGGYGVWATRMLTAVSGLTQLAGAQVAVLADGNVLSSPLNPSLSANALTVSSGGVLTLPTPAMRGSVGIPFQVDIETMPVEVGQGTILDRAFTTRHATPILYNTVGLWIGPDGSHLTPWIQPRNGSATPLLGQPVVPWTGPARVAVSGRPESLGQVWCRQYDPLPLAVSGMIIRGEVSDG